MQIGNLAQVWSRSRLWFKAHLGVWFCVWASILLFYKPSSLAYFWMKL